MQNVNFAQVWCFISDKIPESPYCCHSMAAICGYCSHKCLLWRIKGRLQVLADGDTVLAGEDFQSDSPGGGALCCWWSLELLRHPQVNVRLKARIQICIAHFWTQKTGVRTEKIILITPWQNQNSFRFCWPLHFNILLASALVVVISRKILDVSILGCVML